ncbi:unnamed protein product [Oppiella nova]|uniref:RING-CH-type domain-containing protein n=1 Tax=Oppiella nova TaxID=334625 RepID=A0A7R9QI89_9ACAR|nr:unnamed protein product [Oppiella nova]CAG2165870.1 unnamed protein product [Oppiella nova]
MPQRDNSGGRGANDDDNERQMDDNRPLPWWQEYPGNPTPLEPPLWAVNATPVSRADDIYPDMEGPDGQSLCRYCQTVPADQCLDFYACECRGSLGMVCIDCLRAVVLSRQMKTCPECYTPYRFVNYIREPRSWGLFWRSLYHAANPFGRNPLLSIAYAIAIFLVSVVVYMLMGRLHVPHGLVWAVVVVILCLIIGTRVMARMNRLVDIRRYAHTFPTGYALSSHSPHILLTYSYTTLLSTGTLVIDY